MTKKVFIFIVFMIPFLPDLFSQNLSGNDQQIGNYKEASNIFRIEIKRSSYVDETVVAFFAAASDAFDAYDSEKMFSSDNNYPQTYTLTTDAEIVVINGESILTSGVDRIVPLGFHTDVADFSDNFVFTATNLASFDATINVYLEDLQQNVLQNLRTDNTYNFSSGVVDNATRFRLHFITPTSTDLISWTGSISTDWSVPGNWSTGNVPAADDHVFISSVPVNQPHVTSIYSSPATCNDLNIYSGASLTVDESKALTMNGNFSNLGAFTIKSDASGTGSFMNVGTISGTGIFTVEKYLSDSHWWYVGSPMSNATSDAFGTLSSTPSTGIRLLEWDETIAAYNDLTAGTENLSPLQGFAYHNYNTGVPETAVFTGALNYGPLSDNTLSLTATGIYDGFNLVSNPYPSAIDIEVFGPASTGIDNTVWFKSGSNYPTYNWISDIGSLGGQKNIPSMQAFWVRATSNPGTITLDNSSRLHDDQAFYKNELTNNIFRIEISRDTYIDEAVVAFFAAASDTYDAYDSEKMFSTDQNNPQTYTLTSDSTIVVINGLAEISSGEVRTVSLGFVSYVTDTFSFHATNLSGFDASIPVFLEDIYTSTTQDLRINDTYNFTSGPVNDADRFRLHFGSITTDIGNEISTANNIYSNGKNIYVCTADETNSIEIYDMIGNLIISKKSEKGLNVVETNLCDGIYIVKLFNRNSIEIKKVLIH
jgi:hypothetical protein